MDSPIWAFLTLHGAYFLTLLEPFQELFWVFALGPLCLFVGLVLGLRARRRSLFLFLIPFGLSEAMLAAAIAVRGQFHVSYGGSIILAFLGAQLLLALGLMWRLRKAWAASLFLSLFSLSYALFAAYIALYAFAGPYNGDVL